MTIPIPTGSKLQFDMNAQVIRTLEEFECDRVCDKCPNNRDGYGKLEITDKNSSCCYNFCYLMNKDKNQDKHAFHFKIWRSELGV